MKEVIDFVAQERSKIVGAGRQKNKLIAFFDEIKYLRNEGMSAKQIQVFLANHGVVVSLAGIYQFLKKHELTTKANAKAINIATASEINEKRLPQFLSKDEKQHYIDMDNLI